MLERQGIVDGCITCDSDLFVLGSKLLVFVKLWTKAGECYVIQRDAMLAKLGEEYRVPRPLTDDEVLALGVLCGTDYLKPGFGPVTLKAGKFAHFLSSQASREEVLLEPNGDFILSLDNYKYAEDKEESKDESKDEE